MSNTPDLTYTERSFTPMQTVQAANEMAVKFSPDAPLRALAHAIIGPCNNVFRFAPHLIAKWIITNIQYGQESPGIELLQGPYTTLPAGLTVGNFTFKGIGVGDCDDLSILFATLCRACGCEAYLAGIYDAPFNGGFVHAMGYCASNGKFYELSQDEPYGGIPNKPLELDAPPVGQVAVIYDPVTGDWEEIKNNPFNPQFSYSVDGGNYNQERMAATTRPGMAGPFGGGPKRPKILTGEEGVDLPQAAGDATAQESDERWADNLQETYQATREFGDAIGLDGPSNGADNAINTFFNGEENWMNSDLRPEGMSEGEWMLNSLFKGGASVASATGNNAAARVAGTSVAAFWATKAMVGLTPAPPPVTLILAAAAGSAIVVAEMIRYGKLRREAGRNQDRYVSFLRRFPSEIVGGAEGDLDRTIQAMWLRSRLSEFVAITSTNYGAGRRQWRGKVRTTSLRDAWDMRGNGSLGYMEHFGFDGREYTQLAYDRGAMGHLDGAVKLKGIEWVCGKQVTPTERITREGLRGLQQLEQIVNGITEAYGMAGSSRTQAFKLGLTTSLMAQMITLGLATVPQTSGRRGTSDLSAINRPNVTQSIMPIDRTSFWSGFEECFGMTPEECVRPIEDAFGATLGSFDDGLIGQYISGGANFAIFRDGTPESAWAEAEELEFEEEQSGGGTGLALGAAAVGAAALYFGSQG